MDKPLKRLTTGERARARAHARKILLLLESIAQVGSFGHSGSSGSAAGRRGTGTAARASATAATACGSMFPGATTIRGSHVAPGGRFPPEYFDGALGMCAGALLLRAFEGASAINTSR